MIDGVVGVIIWTDTLTVMRAFYSDILGLELHSEHDNFIFYKWGDMRLGIGIHSKVKGKAVDPYRLMINLGVQDIFQEYTSLVEKLGTMGVNALIKNMLKHVGISIPSGPLSVLFRTLINYNVKHFFSISF